MAYDGFDEQDIEFMRTPGSKMLLRHVNGASSNIVTVISYDESIQEVSVQYDRNEFMKQSLLDRLRPDIFAIDLREYEHQWIDPESDLYCLACHSLELDHLFVCNHDSHEGNQVAFHDRCLDVNLGHIVPDNNTARSWICPMHSNVLQKVDPKSLRRRRGDYDFDFDRPLKKRKLSIHDPNWLNLPKDLEPVYPIHIECQLCYSEGIGARCDGHRPCGHCMKYVEDEVLDLTQPKYITMNEQEIQSEIESCAVNYCKNRDCLFDEFENDEAVRFWLQMHNNKLYQQYIQEKREKDQEKQEEAEDDDIDMQVMDATNNNNKKYKEQSDSGLNEKEAEELTRLKFDYKEVEFVESVPIYAKHQCKECEQLFSDKYRYNMHCLMAHENVIASKKAKHAKWEILNHFQSNKPLKYACPYAGCLRGANSSDQIEDHILRHHDITDPTKPKQEVNKSKSKKKTLAANHKTLNAEQEVDEDVLCVGVKPLSQAEKRTISKIWHEAKSMRIDTKNQRELVKNFVAAIVSDNMAKFDKTTKRLQREYKHSMDRIANNNNRSTLNDLPPPLTMNTVKEDNLNSSGPKSLWQ